MDLQRRDLCKRGVTMQDRVPTYPNRVILNPVAGQENTYDIVRADEPQQEGTPLNKATLLDDTTAEKLGLTGEPTVNQGIAGILQKPIRAKLTVSGWTAVDGGYTQSVAVAGLLTTDDTRTRVDPVRSESGYQDSDEAFASQQEPGAYVGCKQDGYLYCRVVNTPTAAIKLQVTIGR